jgi:hypothetical protein
VDRARGIGDHRIVIAPREVEDLPFGSCGELGAEGRGIELLGERGPHTDVVRTYAIRGLDARRRRHVEWANPVDGFDLTAERGRDGAVDVRTPAEIRAMSDGVDRDQDRRDRDHGEHDVLHGSLPPFCSGPFCPARPAQSKPHPLL